MLRILLVPVVMWLIAEGHFGIAFAIFVVAAVTDFIDGYLARRWDVTSVLGAFLDTIADKLLIVGTLFALVDVERVWVFAAFVIAGREMVVMGLRGIAGLSGTPVPASILGKAKAWAQFIAVGFAIVRFPDKVGPLYFDEWLMLVAVAVTLMSGAQYIARFQRVLRPVS